MLDNILPFMYVGTSQKHLFSCLNWKFEYIKVWLNYGVLIEITGPDADFGYVLLVGWCLLRLSCRLVFGFLLFRHGHVLCASSF